MPTYDYECSKCGHTFDAFQSMSDDPLTMCPECKKPALRRLIGGGLGVIFKGSGFYATDSRSGGSSKAASGAAAASVSDSSGDTSPGPADSKPGDSKPGTSSASSDTAKAAASTGSEK